MTAPRPKHIRDRLARILLGIEYDDLPDSVVHQAKRIALDSFACAIGGFSGQPTEIVRKFVRRSGGREEATVMGSGEMANRVQATFANGTALRYLDHNDYYYRRDNSHASGNVAAAFAVAEAEGLGGREALLGTIIGYEMQLRLCHHCGSMWNRGWASATNLAMSGAVLSSKLMGLDETATANAIAIAGSHNNTLTESKHGNIPMLKATAEAFICKGGVEAAMLAADGLTGPEQIFEGRWGWIPVIAGDGDPDGLTQPMAGRYMIMDTCLKPYAAEMMTQSSVQAAIDVVAKNGIDPRQAKRIVARFHEFAFKKPSWDEKKLDPKDRETADHSFTYCIAVALLDGACGPEQFTEAKLADPDVRAVMAKIGTAITVEMTDGKTFEEICDTPPGHPENPMSDSDIEDKFRRLCGGVLSDSEIERAIEATWKLEDCDDLGGYMALFTPGR
jgi:2-methylcitrate dehydratase